MCNIDTDEITRASLCSWPGRISGHWAESQICPIQAVVWCPLVAIASFGLNFHGFNLVYFGKLQNSSGDNLWLVSHFVGPTGTISLGEIWERSLGTHSLLPCV